MVNIYVITNTVDGRQYVGATHFDIARRFSEHVHGADKGSNSPLQAAIRVTGVENFKVELLDEVADDDAKNAEVFWMRELNTLSDGYNVAAIGWSRRRKVARRWQRPAPALTSAFAPVIRKEPKSLEERFEMAKADPLWEYFQRMTPDCDFDSPTSVERYEKFLTQDVW